MDRRGTIQPIAGVDKGIYTFPMSGIERNSATGVQTCLLRFCTPALQILHHEDTLTEITVLYSLYRRI